MSATFQRQTDGIRFALGATLLAVLVQLAPLLFLGRPVGVADIATQYAPWATPGAPPPANPLLDDAGTGTEPYLASLKAHPGDLLAFPGAACGAIGPLAGVFGLLAPSVVLCFGLLPRSLAFTGFVLFDLLAAFWGFYLWRRSRGDGDLPASVGAAVWAWAPARTVIRTWPHSSVTLLFPLLLLAVDRELRAEQRPGFARRTLVWTLLGCGVVLGGHPSFGMMGIWLAVAYGLARLLAMIERPAPSRALAAPVLGAILTTGLLFPVLVLGRAFLRDGEWIAVRAPIESAPPLPWRTLLLLFDPSFYGDPSRGNWQGLGWGGADNLVELQLYMGLAALLLAPLALASPRRREALFFAAGGASVLLALFAGGPFAGAARLLPGLGLAFLSRLRIVSLFCAAVLASLGVGVLARSRTGQRPLVLPSLLLFTVLDLSLADQRFDPFPARSDAPAPETPALRQLRDLAPGNGHRFIGFDKALLPFLGLDSGLEDIRSHMAFTAGYRRFLSRLDPEVFGRWGTFLTFESTSFRPDPFALDLLGVSALVAPPGSSPPGGDFAPAYEGSDARVFSRPWHPPAGIVSRRGTTTAETGLVSSFAADRLSWRLTASAPEPSTLLLGRSRLSYLDRVLIDGSPSPPRSDPRAEGLLAVDLPAGTHTVEADIALPAWLLVPPVVALLAIGLLLGGSRLL